MTTRVNADNFVVAETARMFDNVLAMSGGVNEWFHFRAPTPIEQQPVIRMNRDTLYSGAVVDLAGGASLTLPDTAGRYLSVMAVNDTHHLHRFFTEPGEHELSAGELGSRYVLLAARFFVDAADAGDVATVNALQQRLVLTAGSAEPFAHPAYDPTTLGATRDALLQLSSGIHDTFRTFGRADEVDPVRHLVATASAFGGLPEHEALYIVESEPRTAGHFTLTCADMPVDAFWSVTVYNRDGYLEQGATGSNCLNSITSSPEPDGRVVIHLAPEPGDGKNHLDVMDGWNYAIRLYRPRPEVLDRTWTPPSPVAA